MKTGMILGRVLSIAVPTALGLAAVLYAGELKKLPDATENKPQPAPVRVITLAPTPLTPRIVGYGTVEPVRSWSAIARVAGEITDIADPLAPGDIVTEGSLLFTIDDSDLKLDLANLDAQLAASEIKDETVRASIAIAQSDLELAQADLARQEQLATQGVITQTVLDNSRRAELTARTKHVELENQLVLNAAERAVLATQRASVERSIGLADIRAPYDLRVTDVSADLGQYVGQGQNLLTGEGVEAVDISVQFPIGKIGPLLRLGADGGTVTDLSAKVILAEPGKTVSWPAQVIRTGDAIDAGTQSAAIVVRVDDPLSQSKAGERPPLRRNMFVEVELSAPKRPALVVPYEAVQNGMALVVSEDETLAKRPVQIGFVSGDLAVISSGLKPGDKLVVTDPSIALPGMAVKPVEDEARKAEIIAAASGESGAQSSEAPVKGSGAGKNKEVEQ